MVLGRNLRTIPTEFGQKCVFGRNSDGLGVVRNSRVANPNSVPNSIRVVKFAVPTQPGSIRDARQHKFSPFIYIVLNICELIN